MKTSWIALLLALAFLVPSPPARGDELVPADLQAKILLRALAYDRSLPSSGGALPLAVVFKGGDADSEKQRAEIVKAFAASNRTVKGREVKVAEIPASATLRSALLSAKPEAVYVCAGAEGALADVRRFARESRVRSMAASAKSIGEVSLVIGLAGGFPKVLVNLPVAKEQGVDFDFELLKVAQVIRE